MSAGAGAGAGAGTAEPQSRVTLKTWTAISLWSYDVDLAENCAICLNALGERCIDCTVDLSSPEECVQVWGVCSYVPLAACVILLLLPGYPCSAASLPQHDTRILMRVCGADHQYHQHCIQKYLRTKPPGTAKCPLCK
jgi:hypothetical protein